MIQSTESKPGEGMTLRTVSLQGTQLSASERRRLEFQRRFKASNPDLAASVDTAIERHRQAVEQGSQFDDPYRFRFESQSRFTPWLGDVFGYSAYDTEESKDGL